MVPIVMRIVTFDIVHIILTKHIFVPTLIKKRKNCPILNTLVRDSNYNILRYDSMCSRVAIGKAK